VGSLDGLLELAARDTKSGVPDAPWPGQFRGAPPPARAKRRPTALLVIAKSADRDAALAGLQRWLTRYATAAAYLKLEDILVDSMRGRSSNWTRVRVNLQHVPEEIRPKQERADPDQEPG
jgi:bifunctional non-homologous end joining protein LigD